MHPDVVHMGTERAALDIENVGPDGNGREFVHVYDIDLAHPSVSPVTWGEENQILEEDNAIAEMRRKGTLDEKIKSSRESNVRKLMKGGMPEDLARREVSTGKTLFERQADLEKKFSTVMSGVQPSLWEETPADVIHSVETSTTLPYRNRREDIGSTSFIVPKANIGTKEDSPVVYRGVLSRDQLVDQIIENTVRKAK